MFRQRPSELFFEEARKRNVGIIARVPLASGLLTGKFSSDSKFGEGDHRKFNRKGEMFDRGETFAGIDFETGLQAVDKLKALFPDAENLAPVALQWILSFPEISCIIPGASRPEHILSNLSVYNLKPMSEEKLNAVKEIYERFIKESVHQLW
jgi:aryl-alcohol dehydrogenase-like predicted oxidoreductase